MARAPAGGQRTGHADPQRRSRAVRSTSFAARDGRRDEPPAPRQDADPGHAGQDRWRDGPGGDAAAAAGRAHQRDPGPRAQVLEREDRRAPRDRSGRVNVAVLGASHGGFTVAADLALTGHTVRLWARSAQALGPLAGAPTIALAAEGRSGAARLALATTDLGEALAGAEIVIAAIPATGHDDLAKRLAPHVTERHIIVLTPGTLGSYAMARALARAGAKLPFALAETGTLPYLTRKTGPAAASAPVRAANLPLGVFPASRSKQTFARLADLFLAARPCVDALDAALTNAGPVIHPPLVLLNAGPIDGGRFDVHAAGTTPSVRRLIDTVDAERIATRRGWGYPAPHYELATYYDEARAAEGLYGAGARAKLLASGLWSEVVTLQHRYVTEDVAFGLTLLESAARAASVETPAISGLLLVFQALLGRELSGRGRALEHLGLGDFSRREIRAFLREGWDSPMWAKVLR